MKEVWVRKNGDIAETERNPCGCCYDDYNMTHKAHVGCQTKTCYIGYYPRKKFLSLMRHLGYIKIGNL